MATISYFSATLRLSLASFSVICHLLCSPTNRPASAIFFRFYIYVLIYYICYLLYDLPICITGSRFKYTSLELTSICLFLWLGNYIYGPQLLCIISLSSGHLVASYLAYHKECCSGIRVCVKNKVNILGGTFVSHRPPKSFVS